MAIPYGTTKANILAIVILGSTAKFNSRQYFWLCGMLDSQYLLTYAGNALFIVKLDICDAF